MVIVNFNTNERYATAYGLWQYDYGQTLAIHGLSLPTVVEIHFSLLESGGEAKRRIGTTENGITTVTIPDYILEVDTSRSYTAFAFVYVTDDTSGQTEYKIRLPIKARPKPEEFILSDPDRDEDPFSRAIRIVQDATDSASISAIMSESYAMGGTGTRDGEDTDNAKYYAGQASQSANASHADMESTEQMMQSVAKMKDDVSEDESTVSGYVKRAESAKEDAELAQGKAEKAQSSAESAKNEALEAQGKAESAQGKAENANAQAQQAKKESIEILANVKLAGAEQIKSINDIADSRLGDINTTATNQIADINNAGNIQVENICEKGESYVEHFETTVAEIVANREQITANKNNIKTLSDDARGDAPAITNVASGRQIVLEDSGDKEIQEITFYGLSTQETTQGNQLLDVSMLEIGGIAGANGNDFNTTSRVRTSTYISVDDSQSYIVTPPENIQINTILVYASDYSFIGAISHTNNIFTINDASYVRITFRKTDESDFADAELETFKNSNIMLNKGTTPLPFEPYTGGIPSPNPKYPQDIVNVGDSGGVETKSTGKNLWIADKSQKQTIFGLTIEYLQDEDCYVFNGEVINAYSFLNISNKVRLDIGGKYTLTNIYVSGTITYNDGVYAVSHLGDGMTDGEVINWKSCSLPSLGQNSTTMEARKTYLTRQWFYISKGILFDNYKFKIQLEKKDHFTDYEPYKSNNATFTLSEPLHGIQVSSGGNVTIDGQEYISDVLVKRKDGSGKIIKNINRKIFDGTEKFSKYSNRPWIFYTKLLKLKCGNENCLYAKSNYFVNKNTGWSNNVIGEIITNNSYVCFTFDLSYSVDDFKNWLAEKYATDNPVYVEYALAEPIVTELTPDQTSAFLQSYKPNTIITNSDDAYMDVTYVVDTQSYVDKTVSDVEKKTQESLVTDKTLTFDNKIADSKVVGDRFVLVENDIAKNRDDIIANKSDADKCKIVCGASGNQIVLNDSSDSKIEEIAIYGMSTQETTQGNQLIPSTEGTFKSNGVETTFSGNYCHIVGTCTISGGRTVMHTNNFTLEPGDYTLWFDRIAGNSKVNFCLTNPSDSSYFSGVNSESIKRYINFTVSSPITLYLGFNVTQDITYNDSFNFMLNKGDTPLPFEPYTGGIPSPNPQYRQDIKSIGDSGEIEAKSTDGDTNNSTLSIALSEPLRGIPVSSGGNVTIDGQQYISDVLIKRKDGSGRLVQHTNCIKLADLAWRTWGVNYAVDGITGFYSYISNLASSHVLCNIICERTGIYGGANQGIYGFVSNNSYIGLSIYNTYLDDIGSKEMAIQSFVNLVTSTNAIAIIQIQPIVTELTVDQTSSFLKSYKPNTIITNSDDAYMDVTYVADPKTYIDNKFADLQEALLAVTTQ